MSKVSYEIIVGSIVYFMMSTELNIAYAVGKVKWRLRYLKATIGVGGYLMPIHTRHGNLWVM